jgi:hypothetical protein
MPLGLWLLSHLNAKMTYLSIGSVIAGASLWMIARSSLVGLKSLKRTLPAALLTGFLGGAVGGLSANPGPVMVIWSNLLGLNKDQQRATVQPFILSMQVVAIGFFLIRGGVFSGCLLILWVASFLVILITTRLGVLVFRKMSNSAYTKLVLILLVISGSSLIAKGSGYWSELLARIDHLFLML